MTAPAPSSALPPLLAATIPAPAINTVHCIDALELLKRMPSQSVNCIVTSPPYFGLRDYSTDGQYGSEETPQTYVAKLVTLFREARRVLRDDGTFWLNLGDSYNGSGKGGGTGELSKKQVTNKGSYTDVKSMRWNGLPDKSLMGIPWRVAFALQDDGWILRSDIIWNKPNPMPFSGKDRPTTAHEYIFLFSKCGRYWYDADAIKTPVKISSIKRQGRAVSATHKNHDGAPGQTPHSMFRARANKQDALGKRQYTGFNERYEGQSTPMANKRSVWTVPTVGFPGAHFATFPPELIRPMILAGCPLGGAVFDPFMGSGTTALVARQHGRNFIGSELNPDYVAIARDRLRLPFEPLQVQHEAVLTDLPLFAHKPAS